MAWDLVTPALRDGVDGLFKNKPPHGSSGSAGAFSQMVAGVLDDMKSDVTAKGKTASSAIAGASARVGGFLPGGGGRIADQTGHIDALLDNPDYAGLGIDELADGLDGDLADYADRAMQPYADAGIASASENLTGTVYIVDSVYAPLVADGSGRVDWAQTQANLQRQMARRQEPEYFKAMGARQAALKDALRERGESGDKEALREEFGRIASRAALMRAAENIDGFAAEYAADPATAVENHRVALNLYMNGVVATLNNGEVGYRY